VRVPVHRQVLLHAVAHEPRDEAAQRRAVRRCQASALYARETNAAATASSLSAGVNAISTPPRPLTMGFSLSVSFAACGCAATRTAACSALHSGASTACAAQNASTSATALVGHTTRRTVRRSSAKTTDTSSRTRPPTPSSAPANAQRRARTIRSQHRRRLRSFLRQGDFFDGPYLGTLFEKSGIVSD